MSKPNVEDIYPLSPGQRGMLTVVLLAGSGSDLYFDQSTLTLGGELDAALLRRAWQRVMDRHPSLRTLFVWERQGEPLQVVRRQVELPWQELDWRGLAPAERDARLERFLREDRARGVDLGTPPLMRCALIRWEEQTWKMAWSFHHLIVDGWSLPRVLAEVIAIYAAFREGREPELAAPRGYRNYIAWLQRQNLARAEAFWRDALAGFDEPTPLPYDGTGAGAGIRISGRELGWIPPAEAGTLSALSRRLQLTLNTLFQGAWGALLARATDRDDVIFGGVVSGRPPEVEGIESVVGFFINVLPVRVRMGNETVGAALADLQRHQVEQRDFEYVPLETIQAWSGLPLGSRQIETLLVFQNFPLDPLEATGSLPGFRILETRGQGASHYPVSLYVAPRAGGLDLSLYYHESRLDADAARRLLTQLRTLLAAFAARPETPLSELPLLTGEERCELLARGTGPAARSADLCVHALFAEQAARTPEAPAVEAAGEILPYRELAARAERLARRLRRLGVGPESVVGLCVERSPAMVVGMLGVLRAGGIYLPLDPVYPRERLAFMLEDSGARVLLTQEHLAGSLPGGREIVLLDGADLTAGGKEPVPAASPVAANGAYLIYTSGSTGRPKAVLVPHAALVNYVRDAAEDAGIGAGDRVLQFASMSFDTSAEEIYPCLTRGATLVLRDEAMAGPPDVFLREVERLGITVLDLPTAYWHELVAGLAADGLDWPACVRLVILGGEAAQAARLDAWRGRVGERCRLLNTYGPTEATIVATRRDLGGPRNFPAEVPIGRPVAGVRAHVVSRRLELLPAGLTGELVLGGAGLARGYLGRPDLTAERFVPDPFAASPGGRLYRTGDLARWLPAGELEHRGRTDHQVKVRGFRVELGEIEAALRRLAGVREAAVAVREEAPGERWIVAYVVPAGEPAPTSAELRAGLRQALPDYMLPAAIVLLEDLPLTPSGKIDRRALPAPDSSRPAAGTEFVAPRNPVEEALAAVWAEVLRRDAVGVHDNFFELGGDSIRTIQVVSRSRKRGIRIAPLFLFQHPTIAELAAVVEVELPASDEPAAGPELPALARPELEEILAGLGRTSALGEQDVEDAYPLSPGQHGMLMVVLLSAQAGIYCDRHLLTLGGELDLALWRRAWQRVVDRHPSLRTLFVWERREQPLQVVCRRAELPWAELDWSDLPVDTREARLAALLGEESGRGFDLARPPLMRCTLVRWEAETWKMVWSYHHLIADGWSLTRLFSEAVACYAAFREGREPQLEAPHRFGSYIAWLQRQDLARAEAFWRAALAGFDEPTPLPYDGTGLEGDGLRYGSELSWIAPAEAEELSALARRHQLTLNTLFQGAWGALLARATGRGDAVFGSVVSGRPGEVEGIESVVGFFINVLPVWVKAGGKALGSALAELQSLQAEQRDFEHSPLESLQAWSGLPRGSRLFETLLVFQNFPLNPLAAASLPGFRILDAEGREATHYPVTLYVAPRAGGLDLRLDHHLSRLDAAAARRLLAHLRTVLAAFVSQPEIPLAETPLLTAAERRELLAGAAGPPAGAAAVCIHALVEEQAARTPEAPAVEAGGRILTYRELEERASRLARRLGRLGVGPESIVGLCAERSPEMVVGMLGVLKAGGAYLPLDPVYPRERLAFMLEDSGARVLLTQEPLAGSLPAAGLDVVLLDGELAADGEPGPAIARPLPGNGAYVIYTSGSTGRPKGVLVPHAALVNYVRGAGEDAGIGAGDRVLQFASMSFDTSAEEIYPCLTRGATLVLRDDAMAGAPESFLREVERLGLTVLDLPTAYWHELVDGMARQDLGWPACARLVILGGEQAREDRLDTWRQRVGERSRLLNTYGPTEATIVATRRDLNGPRDFPAAVPVGRPVPGARVHVVSPGLELLPGGLDGELVIGGAGLSRGYPGRPDLTAERFVPDPFAESPGERLYRTGDLARRLPSGELELRGRTDHQVKVRGFRVELGEIEAALRRLAGVSEAAVAVREEAPGERRIVAYVVPAGEAAPSTSELLSKLQERLPGYMIPAAFVTLEALPLTPSGKLDRRALPAPDAARPVLGADYVAPRDAVEEILAAVWAELLRLDRVGIHDNFLELGGDSILAIQAATRSRQRGVQLTPRQMLLNQTIAQLAAVADASDLRAATIDAPPLAEEPDQEILDSVLAELSEEKGF
jgi:amino acid adenylation domain-containing protein